MSKTQSHRSLSLSLACALLMSPMLAWAQKAAPAPGHEVALEAMTWPEVKRALQSGDTTVIIPTGGIEQNGPHIALGKHNYIIRYTAIAIAAKAGHTLVAPMLPYVPEGDVHPPSGHMRFPGTISLAPEHFAFALEDIAASLKEHGFKLICFIGEHGLSQPVQAEVARKLSKRWKSEGVRVVQIGDYYDSHNGQVAWLKTQGIEEADPEAHGGLADTAESLAMRPQSVREDLRGAYTPADMEKQGAGGSSLKATRVMGAKLIQLKIDAAVAEILRYQKEMSPTP
jgi:creatinine amidohydrolase/Fe(II)-dependent formamide hydrolase-like protein